MKLSPYFFHIHLRVYVYNICKFVEYSARSFVKVNKLLNPRKVVIKFFFFVYFEMSKIYNLICRSKINFFFYFLNYLA